ncbi:hypothetical protein [Xanthomonas translucens]|uniref:hypothetical protein n=1 Tax=Xanthomonas campestris pv. translucens TaxID=343 RepID=UPI001E374F6F|nr:hypothetical protein [Xanthomonas translucens]
MTLGFGVWPVVIEEIAMRAERNRWIRPCVAAIVAIAIAIAIAGARTGSKSRGLRRAASILVSSVFNVLVGVAAARAQASADG